MTILNVKIAHPSQGTIEIDFVPALPTWSFVGDNRSQFIHVINSIIGKIYRFDLVTPQTLQLIEKEVHDIAKSWIDAGSVVLPATV